MGIVTRNVADWSTCLIPTSYDPVDNFSSYLEIDQHAVCAYAAVSGDCDPVTGYDSVSGDRFTIQSVALFLNFDGRRVKYGSNFQYTRIRSIGKH